MGRELKLSSRFSSSRFSAILDELAVEAPGQFQTAHKRFARVVVFCALAVEVAFTAIDAGLVARRGEATAARDRDELRGQIGDNPS